MQEKGGRTIEELLAAYPDVSVLRHRSGEISIYFDGREEISLSLGRDTPDQARRHLTIMFPQEARRNRYPYIKISAVSPETTRIEIRGLDGENFQRAIQKAKQGLGLFRAAGVAGPKVNIPEERVSDKMLLGDDRFWQKLETEECSIIEKARLSGEEAREAMMYAHPSANYHYMSKLLGLVAS